MSMCDDDCGDKERQQVRLIREILKMNPETLTTVIEKRVDTSEKFIESCLEHLKKIEIPDSHIQDLCNDVSEAKDDAALFEAMKLVVQGNRADVIYAFQEFAVNFLREKENDEEVDA